MKLALRLFAAAVFAVVVLLCVDGLVFTHREDAILRADAERTARRAGRLLRAPVEEVWRARGEDDARALLDDDDPDGRGERVRFVRVGTSGRDAPRCADLTLDELRTAEDGAVTKAGERAALYVYVPLALQGEPGAALEVREGLDRVVRLHEATVHRVVLTTIGLVVFGGLLSWFLGVRLVGRPLRRLVDKTRRIAAGDLETPVEVGTGTELHDLAVALNEMGTRLAEADRRVRAETEQRIQALEQLRHADRLKTVGQFASGMAHELGTPLNVISGRAGLLLGGRLDAAEAAKSAQIIRNQTERMTTIIRQLLGFARRGTPRRRGVDLLELARQTRDLLAPLGHKGSIEVARGPAPVFAEIDAGQVQQVLTNLIVNALEAMPDGGVVRVSAAASAATPPAELRGAPGPWARLRVEDSGTGMDEDTRRRLFDPFFTTKEPGKGTGLGLSIVHGIVRDHGGWIDVESEPGSGTRFDVYLPAAKAADANPETP